LERMDTGRTIIPWKTMPCVFVIIRIVLYILKAREAFCIIFYYAFE